MQAVEDYFTAFAEGRYRVMRGVSTGPAGLYADYQVAGIRSVNGPAPAGFERVVELEGVTEHDRGIRVHGEVRLELAGGSTRFREFEVVQDGDRWVLDDYTRDGRPLHDFIVAYDSKATGAGLLVAARLAFRDPSAGSLSVPVSITNQRDEPADLLGYRAVFAASSTGADHRIAFAGPGALAAGESVELVLVFTDVDDAGEGGSVTLTFDQPGGSAALDQPLAVPAFGNGE